MSRPTPSSDVVRQRMSRQFALVFVDGCFWHAGWTVVRVWEHEVTSEAADRVEGVLRESWSGLNPLVRATTGG